MQRIVEGENGDIRRRLYDYSSRIETQRRLIADWRQGVLEGSAPTRMLARRSPDRWSELRRLLAAENLDEVERRLTLLTLDRCWSEHLAELERIRDELAFVAFDGRVPLVEFVRIAAAAFEEMLQRIDDEIVAAFETLPIGPQGVDWEAAGLQGPSATWNYLVGDGIFGENTFLTLAVRPSLFLGAVMIWPALFLWALYQHWARRRSRPT